MPRRREVVRQEFAQVLFSQRRNILINFKTDIFRQTLIKLSPQLTQHMRLGHNAQLGKMSLVMIVRQIITNVTGKLLNAFVFGSGALQLWSVLIVDQVI